ncbi:MAG: PspA/IM30 family protein, partial [Desulfobulbaceae bacterium]|nr:PspA/IM30 family protein [Desulfobulbaceae bacterium]
QNLGKIIAKKHLASTRLTQENRRHQELSKQVEVALNDRRDDLAEVAVAAQLDIEAQIPILESTVNDCANQEKELESYIEALLAKKRQMKDELRAYKESQQQGHDGDSPTVGGSSGGGSVEGKVTKAESAFERVMEKASGLAGSSRSLDRKNASQMAELEELTRKNRIQERLAVIKSGMGKE